MQKIWRIVAVAAALYSFAAFGASQGAHSKAARPTPQVLIRAAQSAPIQIQSDAAHTRVRAVGPLKETGSTQEMSSMGRLAHLAATGQLDRAIRRARAQAARRLGQIQAYAVEECDENDPECEENIEGDGPAGGQAELSVAVDSTGQHIVVGNNDTRGFGLNPVSVSGYAYSDDGGVTFTDGGTLPVTTGTVSIGGTLVPQIFGDPEVKYLGGSNFIYFSIMIKLFAAPNIAVQTMCFHRSTDYGHTWQGPFEVTSATNPNGLVNPTTGAPRDSADKEFADVDPDTGRVIMTWSNFTLTSIAPGGVEISSTYSDNVMAPVPTWSSRVVIAKTVNDGQGSLPRFAKGSNDVYVVWRRGFPGFTANVGFARSTDNGATFSAPINLSPTNYFTMDQVLGNDRNNTSPGIGVDNSPGPYHGNIYVAVANNSNHDGADIQVQRSTNGGVSFGLPVLINSRPGNDRAQWFPWVTVDSSTGRVYIFQYDQGTATSGDLTETTYVFSDDGGATWSKPLPLTDRPFHAGYGNDTGQPNIGDYNQAVAQNGDLFAVWAGNPVSVRFDDGEPTSGSLTVPDIYFKRVNQYFPTKVSLDIAGATFTDGGGNGFIDPGEQVMLNISLRNYVTNVSSAAAVNGISATLSTTTPGVMVTTASGTYPNAAPGATVSQSSPYSIQVMPSFTPGTAIEFVLNVTTSSGSTTLLYRQATGTPNATLLLSENFDGVAPGTLPATFVPSHSGGTPTVPWTTKNTFMGSPTGNAAFHQNENDGTTSPARFERLHSGLIAVPANSDYVMVDFDVAFNTEDDPAFNIQAYDGFLLRFVDFTTGRLARLVTVEAFAEEFTTGNLQFYPKHMPRSGISGSIYLQDLSAWAGLSSGWQHVHMKLPGMNGATVQLRFEYTQDSSLNCAAVRPGSLCGVAFDNFVMKSVVAAVPTKTNVSAVTGQYSDSVNLVATVSPNTATGRPAATGSVAFSVNGSPAGTASINASGVATLSYSIGLPAASYSVNAVFTSTSEYYLSSTGSSMLTVNREDAVVTPPAASSVKVSSPGGSASFSLSAAINEVADGSPGNISNAVPVTFTLTPVGPGSVITAIAATSGGGIGGTLTATASFTGVAPNVYDVDISVGGSFYQGSAETVVSVFDPSLGFITGGGTVMHNGVRANFGFNFKYKKNENVQGNLIYVEHRATGNVVVKSTALDTLSLASTTAIVLGKANVADVGGYSFRLVVTDNDEPGTTDQFGLQVSDHGGAAVPDLSFAPITLNGGNIQIPH